MKKISLEQLQGDYDDIRMLGTNLCAEFSRYLTLIFTTNNFHLNFPIQYRFKSWESIKTKFINNEVKIQKIKDIQDIVGVRIVTLFPNDIERIIKLLSSNFDIIKQYNTTERLKVDQFGYASHHLIVELDKISHFHNHLSNASLRLKAEIQIRTLSQHIWAETSHRLVYKAKMPSAEIERPLYRLSALLEIVDLELQRINQIFSDTKANDFITTGELATSDFYEADGIVFTKIDVDNDNNLEIITPSDLEGQPIAVFKNSNALLVSIPVETGHFYAGWLREVFLTDVDNDGQNEVICQFELENSTSLICYKYQNEELKLLRLNNVGTFFDQDTFLDARIEDYDNDGKLEVVCSPWDAIPPDLLPSNHKEGDYDWGRVNYVWRWDTATMHFQLVGRELAYIGTR